MTAKGRKLTLEVFLMRFGHHAEARRHRRNYGQHGRPSLRLWGELAQRFGAAKFPTSDIDGGDDGKGRFRQLVTLARRENLGLARPANARSASSVRQAG